MTIDEPGRRISAGIRDFIGEADEERWDLPSLPNRPILGIRAHRAYAERRGDTPGFSAEVSISLTFERRGYTFQLSGRMDGIIEAPDHLVVEEVKSMTLEEMDVLWEESKRYDRK